MLFLDIQSKEWSPEPNVSLPTLMIYKKRNCTNNGALLIMMEACTHYLIPTLVNVKHILFQVVKFKCQEMSPYLGMFVE
jgi:hypothetical protein